MSEHDIEQPSLPLPGAGPRLRAAREAQGISRSELAARTRISERMIAQIEAGDFAGLPARTYATGFTRSYARAVGLDEAEMVAEVRRELGMVEAGETRASSGYEPGDPARVPSARFAWLLALLALIVLAGVLWVWRSYTSPAIDLPSILPTEEAIIAPTSTPDVMVPSAVATLDPQASLAPDPALLVPQPAQRRPAVAPARSRAERSTPSATPSPQPETAVQPPQSSPTSTVTN